MHDNGGGDRLTGRSTIPLPWPDSGDLTAGRCDLLAGVAGVLEEFSVGGDLPTGRPGPLSLISQKTNGYMR